MAFKNIKKRISGFKSSLQWHLSTKTIPAICCRKIRHWALRKIGVQMSHNVKTFEGFSIRAPQKLVIEDGVSIGPGVLLDARCGLTIKKNAVIAYDAIIWTLNHDYNDIHFCGKGSPVEIGEYAWVCSRSIILPGVKIGEGAVVASGAIVTKDVDPWTVVGGIPAKKIGERERKEYKYGYKKENDYNHFV